MRRQSTHIQAESRGYPKVLDVFNRFLHNITAVSVRCICCVPLMCSHIAALTVSELIRSQLIRLVTAVSHVTNSTPWTIKRSQLIFVCNFVKN